MPRDQAVFLKEDIKRLAISSELRPVEYSRWVSRAFLVPKPGVSGWRLIVDLREINKHCQTRKMKMETMRSLKLIAKPGNHWVRLDLKDGFYSLSYSPMVMLGIGFFFSANRIISVSIKPNPIYIGISKSQTDKSDTI